MVFRSGMLKSLSVLLVCGVPQGSVSRLYCTLLNWLKIWFLASSTSICWRYWGRCSPLSIQDLQQWWGAQLDDGVQLIQLNVNVWWGTARRQRQLPTCPFRTVGDLGIYIDSGLSNSHVNIVGNERADTAAKSALTLPITNMKLPAGELFPQVSSSALTTGRRYGTVVRVINFILFTPQLALWRIARICRATILYLSTDSALVTLN